MKRDAIQGIGLPTAQGKVEPYQVREPRPFQKPSKPFTRVAYAAAHVVADPFSPTAELVELLRLRACQLGLRS